MQVSSACARSGVRALSKAEAEPADDLAIALSRPSRPSRSALSLAIATMDAMDGMSTVFRSCAATEADDEGEEVLEWRLQVQERILVASGALDETEANVLSASGCGKAAEAEEQSLAEVLQTLEVESADSEAWKYADHAAAKFQLFENYSRVVSEARRATLSFWGEVEREFEAAPATKAEIEREIRAIDTQANLGVQDGPRNGVVHGMVKAAARNARTLDGVLRQMQIELELLTSQDECPVCYDAFAADRPAITITLGCVHKVCTECWEHWCSMAHGNIFCPLCRHEEFLSRILEY